MKFKLKLLSENEAKSRGNVLGWLNDDKCWEIVVWLPSWGDHGLWASPSSGILSSLDEQPSLFVELPPAPPSPSPQ